MNKLLLFVGLSTLSVLASGGNPAVAVSNFQGDYVPGNWSLVNDNTNGNIDSTNAPASITLNGGDTGTGSGSTTYTISASDTGTVSFDWTYNNDDLFNSENDVMGYLFNNTKTQLIDDNIIGTQSGMVSFNVTQGDNFGFYIETDNFGNASTTFSNFQASTSAAVPFEFSPTLGLVTIGGFWGINRLFRQRRKLNP
jgi:hypothetical protein